jgi:methionyl-tRNA formyltransferase
MVLQKILNSADIQVIAVVESHCIKRRNTWWFYDVIDLIRSSGLRYACYLLWITDIFSMLAPLLGGVSIRRLCKQYRLPVIKTSDVNSSESINKINQLLLDSDRSATYFVTTMFNQKLSASLLSIEALQFINLHPGSLPDYRGVDPVLAAMLNGEQYGSVSLHQTIEQLDTGKILAQQSVAIQCDDTLLANNKRFFEAAGSMLVDWLLSANKAAACEQSGEPHYYGWPTSKEVMLVAGLFSLRKWRQLILPVIKSKAGSKT